MNKKKEDGKPAEQTPDVDIHSMSRAKCVSCNTSVVNDNSSAKFACPNCGKYTILRCAKCRKTVAKYKCPVCGFAGPN